MRLIDADALSETLAIVAKKMAKSDAQKALMGRVFYILEHRHEEVVRCRYCKYYDKECGYCEAMDFNRKYDDFCSYGERRADEKV